VGLRAKWSDSQSRCDQAPPGAWRDRAQGSPVLSLRGMKEKSRAEVCACPAGLGGRLAASGTDSKGASSMEFQDKVLKCIDCGAEFVFTAGEQLFFHDKQFRNEPKRCRSCKAKRGSSPRPSFGGGQNSSRSETRAICSQCGRETTIPFKPTQGRPVFCRDCFLQRRVSASA